VEHRHPGTGVGGVTGMDDQPTITQPGTGLPVTDGGVPRQVQVPHVDDATVALVHRNMLVGGQPGSGKSSLMNLLAAHAALTDGDHRPGGVSGTEG
jgi:hypothetical protein